MSPNDPLPIFLPSLYLFPTRSSIVVYWFLRNGSPDTISNISLKPKRLFSLKIGVHLDNTRYSITMTL